MKLLTPINLVPKSLESLKHIGMVKSKGSMVVGRRKDCLKLHWWFSSKLQMGTFAQFHHLSNSLLLPHSSQPLLPNPQSLATTKPLSRMEWTTFKVELWPRLMSQLQCYEKPQARITQPNHSPIPPWKLWEIINIYCCFKPLNFEIIVTEQQVHQLPLKVVHFLPRVLFLPLVNAQVPLHR